MEPERKPESGVKVDLQGLIFWGTAVVVGLIVFVADRLHHTPWLNTIQDAVCMGIGVPIVLAIVIGLSMWLWLGISWVFARVTHRK